MLYGCIQVVIYFVICACVALVERCLIRIPNELFRKILHFILLGSLPVFLFGFPEWYMAAAAAVLFALVVWPLLFGMERFAWFSRLTTERKKGELKSSLLLVFFMFAFVIAICWGWQNDRLLALASIYAWGIGDAAAALIGKKWGHHKIGWKYMDKKKSWEGSAAMFICSFFSVMLILLWRGGLHPAGYVLISLTVAAVSALTEAYTKDGFDTVSCPVAVMIVLLPLVNLFAV